MRMRVHIDYIKCMLLYGKPYRKFSYSKERYIYTFLAINYVMHQNILIKTE